MPFFILSLFKNPTTKTHASLLHFVASLFIFSLFIGVLLYFWYPEPYFTASGGWQGLKLIALVDLVLGPLLTFIVFNVNKTIKELRLDLTIIIALQLSALVWGIHTVYKQRPIATVFWEHSFYTVSYSSVADIFAQSPQLSKLLDSPRQLFYVIPPQTISDINQLTKDIAENNLAPFQMINRFERVKLFFPKIAIHSIDIGEVVSSNQSMKLELEDILMQTEKTIDDYIYIPLISRYQNIILVFNHSGELFGYLKAPFKE